MGLPENFEKMIWQREKPIGNRGGSERNLDEFSLCARIRYMYMGRIFIRFPKFNSMEKIDHAELLERELPLKQKRCGFHRQHFEISIQSRYLAHWVNEINDNSKNPILRAHKLFNLSHQRENYIYRKLDNKYKRAIAQFRVSSHKLGIDTGRHELPIIPLNWTP